MYDQGKGVILCPDIYAQFSSSSKCLGFTFHCPLAHFLRTTKALEDSKSDPFVGKPSDLQK